MRSLVLALVCGIAVGSFACSPNDESIAGDLHLGDDDDGASSGGSSGSKNPSSSSSSSGGSTNGGSSGASSGGSTSSSGGAVGDVIGATYTGEATYYNVDLGDTGNCSLPCPSTYLVAALNTADYDGSALCGGCIQVTGPSGSTIVQVWDRCPGCGVHGIDLSETGFKAVAPLSAGRIDVSWKAVRCPVQDGLEYDVFPDRIQVRNTRVPIDSVEVDGIALSRRNDNFFTGSIPDASFLIRVTGSTGEVVEETVDGQGTQQGTQQFP